MADDEQKGNQDPDAMNWWRRLLSREWVNKVGSHVALLALLVLYTLLGAKIFQELEYEAEASRLQETKMMMFEARKEFLKCLLSLAPDWEEGVRQPDRCPLPGPSQPKAGAREAGEAEQELTARVSGWLQRYEAAAETSVGNGMSLVGESDPRWNYPQAVFFSVTVLTTIGYGNIAPTTAGGRVFCIVFALVGIPLTLTVLANLGQPLVSLLPIATIERLMPKGRMKTAATVVATLSLLVTFIALGGLLFMWLDSRTFMEAFYFCFITTTTIGFGDIVPLSTETVSMLFCLLYILVGLALTTTVIELVQRQYASSWAEMKQLTARLHALSGPLASAMRKLAENGAGEVEMDAALVRELRDLNIALEEVHRRESTSGIPTATEPDPWAALLQTTLSKRRIKLVMYESNV